MTTYNVEEVFKRSGVPSITFVKPKEYTRLLIALRSPGKGVVVEGPSKIGKTSSVMKVLSEIDASLPSSVMTLTARDPNDRDFISSIPSQTDLGIVIIDDFHRLDAAVRESISDFMKILADQERADIKIVIVGINKVGESLLAIAPDLAGRIEVVKLGVNPDEKVRELVKKGCEALNIELAAAESIVEASAGSFNIAQMICFEACISDDVVATLPGPKRIDASFTSIRETVIDQLATTFHKKAEVFATGKRRRKEGRAPYLQILRWLSMSDEWTIDLDREISKNSSLRASVGQVVDKGHLEDHLAKNSPQLSDLLHYDPETRILAVEDPQFFFFIRHLSWNKFSERLGYFDVVFSNSYDFALSFAGSDRDIAEKLARSLQDREISVFYDFDEQALILGCDVETYLAPIYKSEASFVVPIMGVDYPDRLWTRFESKQFADRFGENAVLTVWFKGGSHGSFDKSRMHGGSEIDRNQPIDPQIENLAEQLAVRLKAFRLTASHDPQPAEITA
ncbi:TIR domain-containing protein [Arthrobacter cavernae]|uniref:TIR domain-containing protein n=1 Tax=Arthrobacter cavernae TaxID=2817681 RepID=A0A939HIQ5_9MICC|nr:TIR domain-containing protein [Arthrobacter cavernae]MBO1268028.1 TIR domain-containing protein [Arthrobacter cavernae]